FGCLVGAWSLTQERRGMPRLYWGIMTKRFRVVLTVLALLATAATAAAQVSTWQIDPGHSSAQFSVRHMMVSTVRGSFGKVTGRATSAWARRLRPKSIARILGCSTAE